MKKAILLIALAGTSYSAMAQKKPKADSMDVQKQEFTVDPQKVYQIPLTLNAEAIYAITLSADDWAQVKTSPKLSGEQITRLEQLAIAVRKAITEIQQNAIQKDYEAFEVAKKESSKPPK
ncbi:hypothetical protein [Mucilaginibacter glaciei]|uniref:Uncharacterized protein n=1 Tax=Mucilaginibacter glaciei TaxID=2772109 RepID=A0A926S370_9SPHI|nr:hypothetical protein [Mucilaginibacter glaciei]MBD1394617.1 hypothetical protein [Mucilaginibacter glaciei]